MVDMETIRQAVELLREAANPRKIILFGSYARGDADDDSDVDLLVVEDDVPDVPTEMVRLMRVLAPLLIPAEVIVVGTEQFEQWSKLPGTIYTAAASEGETLYDAA